MLNKLYDLLRPLLFKLDAEKTHYLTLNILNVLEKIGLLRLLADPVPAAPVTVMGLKFANSVGLAAGLDKNATAINALGRLGFGFIEIGTLTPKPQPGNPRPRLFRLPEHQALINRMGFNSKGIAAALPYLAKHDYQGILGISIGKNATTPPEAAVADYLNAFRQVYPHADYIAVNVSSPNTVGLRNLQQGAELEQLLEILKKEQQNLAQQYHRYVPLAVKIAPDLDQKALEEMAALFLKHQVDGVIATNTSLSREAILTHPLAKEVGGLSGAPIAEQSTKVIKILSQALRGQIPIIASGGIMTAADAKAKLAAGASLVQLYTGLIYQGPKLIREIAEELAIK